MDRLGVFIEACSRGKSRLQIRDESTECPQGRGSQLAPKPPRKASNEIGLRPYRKPTLVGREKYPKVIERPSVKELGKMTPYLRKKGCLSTFTRHAWGEEVAKKRLNRLFTKNIGLCERESGRIGADSCPVPEG
jgi:hypothetical protein